METSPEARRYIFKYTVPFGPPVQLLLDRDVEILHVGMQYDAVYRDDVVVFWAYCTDGAPTRPRTFRIIGTGWEVPKDAFHWGTVQQGQYVWHLMEEMK